VEPNCLFFFSALQRVTSRVDAMLSIVTDDGRTDMRGHAAAPTPKSVTIVEPSVPSALKPSGQSQAPSKGRQIRPSVADVSTDGPKKRVRAQTMEELDRRVENDALELLNMKKEIQEQQKLEVKNAMKTLMGIKKEYDALKAENNAAQSKVSKVKDSVLSLRGVDMAVSQSSQQTADTCKELTRQLASVEECVAAEERTRNMQKLMSERLVSDTQKIKIEGGELDFVAEKLRHDLAGVNSTLLVSKTELGDREFKLENMKSQSKSRKKERGTKMLMLNSILQDGQKSVSIVRSGFFGSKGSPNSTMNAERDGLGSPGSPEHFNYNLGGGTTGANESKKKVTISPLPEERIARPSSGAEKEEEDFLTPADSPRKKAQRMTLDEIAEMVDRYRTRNTRSEKLTALEADLKENLVKQKNKSAALLDSISNTEMKTAQLTSRSQMYKDVIDRSHTMNAAKKACEAWKEKDYRLKVNLVSLKRAIPRLLAKLTKTQHPVPTDLQLPDAVARLTTELLRYFKEITNSVMRDANPEEMKQMASGEEGDQSELDKLYALPGFNNLKKELFFNMMSAKPDNSSSNVRIVSKQQSLSGGDATRSQGDDAGSVYHSVAHPTKAKTAEKEKEKEKEKKKEEIYGGPGVDSPVIDREMAKKISNLVFMRDGKGVIPVVEVKTKKEIKKKFVFRD